MSLIEDIFGVSYTPSEPLAWPWPVECECSHHWISKPTDPGWYWCWDGVGVDFVRVETDMGRLGYWIVDTHFEPADQIATHWIGPITPPEPPR